jgi:ATP-dependent Clp protease ATP-binding subunit ClpB
MLARVAHDLDTRGVGMRIEDGALERLADAGFDPEFGARPMRRAIEQMIEDPLAQLVLSGSLKRRDTVVVANDGTLRVEESKKFIP